jgi:sarcosine oxidase
MAEIADVVVIGLGAVGSATLYRLALAGVRAIGIDRFHPPHDRGSSHGESRITRLAVGEGETYAPLVRRSHAIWRELEEQTGAQLMLRTGGLVMGVRGGQAQHHGKDDFVGRTLAVARANAIPHEIMHAAAFTARFPQFALRGDEWGCYEPSAGLLFPERCVAAQLRLAAAAGAKMIFGETVGGLRRLPDGVEITTERRVLHAGRVIMAAGAWVSGLAGGQVAALTRVFRQTLHWFAAEAPRDYSPDRFPVFIWMHGSGEEDYMYGFPALPGATAVKLASERYAATVDPDHTDRDVTEAESTEFFARHVAGRLHGVTAQRVRAASCLYTVTPDSGFIIDTLPQHPNVLVASACSGHGFKHSAALGELLANRALDGAAMLPVAFSIDRYARATQ